MVLMLQLQTERAFPPPGDAVIDTFLDLGLVILDVFCRFHVLDSTPSLLKNMVIVYHISLKKSRALTPKLRFPADFLNTE